MQKGISWDSLPFWAQGLIVTLLSLVIGLATLWYGSTLAEPWKSIIQGVGAIVLTSGFFSWWGAAYAKIEVARFLSGKLSLSEDLQKAGIISVANWPISIPTSVKKVDMLAIRGHAWFKMQTTAIAAVMRNEHCDIRICFVHPQAPIVHTLASKFGESDNETCSKILESILTVVGIAEDAKRAGATGRLAVRGHNLVPSHTYYRFDTIAYAVWYGLRRGRIDVPVLVLGEGTLKKFFEEDFDRLWSERDTITLYDSSAKPDANVQILEAIGVPKEKLNQMFPQTVPTKSP